MKKCWTPNKQFNLWIEQKCVDRIKFLVILIISWDFRYLLKAWCDVSPPREVLTIELWGHRAVVDAQLTARSLPLPEARARIHSSAICIEHLHIYYLFTVCRKDEKLTEVEAANGPFLRTLRSQVRFYHLLSFHSTLPSKSKSLNEKEAANYSKNLQSKMRDDLEGHYIVKVVYQMTRISYSTLK